MPVRVKCPTGHQLIVPDSRCGTVVICPRCDQPVTVPPAQRKSSTPKPPVLSEAAAQEATKQLQAKTAVSQLPSVPTQPPIAPVQPPRDTLPAEATKPKRPKRVVVEPKQVLDALGAKPVGRVEPSPPPAEKSLPEPEPRLRVFAAPESPPEPAPVSESSPPPPEAIQDVEPTPPEPSPTESAIETPIETPIESLTQSPIAEPPSSAEPEPAAISIPAAEPAAEIAAPPALPDKEVALEEKPVPQSPPETFEATPTSVALDAEEEPGEPTPIPLPPEPPPLPAPKRAGVTHEPARLLVAWQVAGAIAVTAIFSLCPALIEIVDHLRADESPGISRWVWAVLLVGLLQLAYAIYIAQLPDWTSLWAASLQSLAVAAGYAAVLGFVVTSRGDHWLLAILQLSDQLAGGRAALWCIAMIAAMSLLAYFSGFVSVRWHKAELVMRSLAARH